MKRFKLRLQGAPRGLAVAGAEVTEGHQGEEEPSEKPSDGASVRASRHTAGTEVATRHLAFTAPKAPGSGRGRRKEEELRPGISRAFPFQQKTRRRGQGHQGQSPLGVTLARS